MKFLCINMNLTLVKDCKDSSIIFPAVSVSGFCDLSITNNKIRLSLDFISYHAELYAAKPISLLYKNGNNRKIFNVLIFFITAFLIKYNKLLFINILW